MLTWSVECVGVDAILDKLGVDPNVGVKDKEDAKLRGYEFGSNFRELMEPKPCFDFFKEQLSDIMLIILIFAACLSLVLSYATAGPEDYWTGKYPSNQRFIMTPGYALCNVSVIGWSCQGSLTSLLWINKINYNLFSLDWWYCDSNRGRSRLGCWIHGWLEKGDRIRQPSQWWPKRQHCKFHTNSNCSGHLFWYSWALSIWTQSDNFISES